MASNSTITAREFYNLVLDATRDADAEDYQLMFTYASSAIEKLDARNQARKENAKPSKSSLEAAERKVAVLNFLTEAGSEKIFTRDDIAEVLGITAGQVTAALTALVKAELVVKIDAKGKSKTTYHLA